MSLFLFPFFQVGVKLGSSLLTFSLFFSLGRRGVGDSRQLTAPPRRLSFFFFSRATFSDTMNAPLFPPPLSFG